MSAYPTIHPVDRAVSAYPTTHPVDRAVFDAQMAVTDFHLGVSRILRRYSADTETEMCQKMAARIYQLEQERTRD